MKLAALVLLGLCAVGALAKTQGEARRRQPEHPTALASRPSIAVAAREAGGGRSPAEHPHQRHPRTAPRPRARHPPPSWAAQWHWAALAGPTATAASGPGSASPPAHRRPPLRRRLGPPQPNPIAPGPIPAAGICETYVVAPGDSVVSIAAKFSVSQSECGGVLVGAAVACLRIPPATQIWPHRSCRNVAGWMSRIVACNDGQAGGMQHSSARLWAGRLPAEAARQRPPTAGALHNLHPAQLAAYMPWRPIVDPWPAALLPAGDLEKAITQCDSNYSPGVFLQASGRSGCALHHRLSPLPPCLRAATDAWLRCFWLSVSTAVGACVSSAAAGRQCGIFLSHPPCLQANQRICLPPTFSACQYVRTAGEWSSEAVSLTWSHPGPLHGQHLCIEGCSLHCRVS